MNSVKERRALIDWGEAPMWLCNSSTLYTYMYVCGEAGILSTIHTHTHTHSAPIPQVWGGKSTKCVAYEHGHPVVTVLGEEGLQI